MSDNEKEYNPYTKESLEYWHNVSCPLHIGWVVNHIVEHCENNNLDEINFLEIGCSTGRLAFDVDQKVHIKSAILVDVIPEAIEYAKRVFENRSDFFFEAIGLSNYTSDGVDVIMPVADPNSGLNLGGASLRESLNTSTRKLPVTTFDALWKEKYTTFTPDIIKIDAETQDIAILESMKNFITQLEVKPFIVFELAGTNLTDDERNVIKNKLKYLTEMGYKPLLEDDLVPNKSCDMILICAQ